MIKKLDISLGGEGMAAMTEINKGFEAINNVEVLEKVKTSFVEVRKTSTNTGLNQAWEKMLAIQR